MGNMADSNLVNVVALVDQLGPAIQRHDRATLNDITERLIAARAPMGPQWERLAQIAARNGELTLARKAIDLFVEASGGQPAAHYQKTGLLAQMGAWRDVMALLDQLGPDVPSPVAQAYSRGTAALYLGDTDEAKEQLDRATRLAPQSGSAWHMLSLVVDLAAEPAMADRLIAAGRGMATAPPTEQGAYHYALGKLHAGRGEHAPAFAAFAQGGQLMKQAFPYPRDMDRRWAADAIDGYSADRIATLARRQREPTGRTIFVTGLPRSGTTLVEQILTSHSAISDGVELDRLGLLAQDMGGQSWSALSRHVEAWGAEPTAALWHHWIDERFPGATRIVDKSVDASRFLGIAAALLPDAPLIWMTRDPLDRAWSCFRTCFLNVPWTNDLEDIAFHFRLEDALLARWQEILGDRLLVVPYEAMVADSEGWIRRILAHCGLAEEPQIFTPHDNHRTVTTASVMQVRRPLNRGSIGASVPYEVFLEPFVQAYE